VIAEDPTEAVPVPIREVLMHGRLLRRDLLAEEPRLPGRFRLAIK